MESYVLGSAELVCGYGVQYLRIVYSQLVLFTVTLKVVQDE